MTEHVTQHYVGRINPKTGAMACSPVICQEYGHPVGKDSNRLRPLWAAAKPKPQPKDGDETQNDT